jgi:hypothetical protein
MCNQLQAGFLTCALPRGSFPSSTNFSNEQWIGIPNTLWRLAALKMPLGFPIQQSEQTLTAARPSRTLTAFPFDYPKPNVRVPAKRGPKREAKYLARGFTTGSLGPTVGLSTFQRTKHFTIRLSGKSQTKKEVF